jgi:peptide deformylase
MKKSIFLLFSILSHSVYSEETIMPLPIFTPPESYLLQTRALEVPVEEILSKETQEIIDQMFEVARGERAAVEKRVMVGLAAPQIGISKRIILVDTGVDIDRKALGALTAYINPEITWYSPEKVDGREGCFSVDSRVAGIVSRSVTIRIQAFDREGKVVTLTFSGMTARIFQHEVDHLEGIRFPDRVGPEGKLQWVEADEYPRYRENWEHWDRPCPWDLWVAMKEGRPYLMLDRSALE